MKKSNRGKLLQGKIHKIVQRLEAYSLTETEPEERVDKVTMPVIHTSHRE